MSQCDGCLFSNILIPEVWNEDEDLGRDLIDWCEPVPPGSDQAEDLGSVLLESANLKEGTREPLPVCLFRLFGLPRPHR